jgi:hypothetical protein
MSLGDRAGIAGVIMAFIGIALPMLFPDKKWIGWVCLSIGALCLIAWLAFELKHAFGSYGLSLSFALAGGGLIGAVTAGIIWASVSNSTQLQPTVSVALFLECSRISLPVTLKDDISIHSIDANAPVGDFRVNSVSTGKAPWPYSTEEGQFAYKCELSNPQDRTVFSVSGIFRLSVLEKRRYAGGATSSGGVVESREQPFSIGKIDPHGVFTFYVWTSGDDFVQFSPPADVSLELLGGSQKVQAELKQLGAPGSNFYVLTPRAANHAPALVQSITRGVLRFDHITAPSLVIVNLSSSLVHGIKWSTGIWNMDLPDSDSPLPIPTNTLDFLRGGSESGPISIFGGPVSSWIKPGNRLFGTIAIDSPSWPEGTTYAVYIVWGASGWYAQLNNARVSAGNLLIPGVPPEGRTTKEARESYFKQLEALAPEATRKAIQ